MIMIWAVDLEFIVYYAAMTPIAQPEQQLSQKRLPLTQSMAVMGQKC